MKIKLLPSQYKLVSDYTTPYIAMVCGYGTGKTFGACAKTLDLARRNIGYDMAFFQPTNNLTRQITVPKLSEFLEMHGIPYTLRLSVDPSFTIHFAEGDTKVRLLSGENWQRIVGYEISSAIVDEVDTIDHATAKLMFEKIIARMRVGNVRQLAFTSTPEGYKFLHEMFVENADEETKLIQASTYENIKNVGERYINNLLKKYPPNLCQAYIHGQFVNLKTGNVYDNFNRDVHHVNKTIQDFQNKILHIGVDFNVNKTCGIVHVVDNGIVYAIDEITSQKNTEALIQSIKARYPKHTVYIYPDSSGKAEKTNASQTDIVLLQKHFQVFYNNKNPFVTDRINSYNAMLRNGENAVRYYVNTNKCPVLTKSLEQQAWDKNGNPDKMHDQDHPVDAAGYFIWFRFPLKRPGLISVK